MKDRIELIVTGDGSHSLYLPELKETYHSTHGAMRESMHVFIRNGLETLPQPCGQSLSILEVGLGTGLNALLTAQWAMEHSSTIHMISLEAFPVGADIWENLNYAAQTGHPEAGTWWKRIHQSPWDEEAKINDHFFLTKLQVRLEDFRSTGKTFDLVYYDAFAPNKQPEMWTPEVLGKATGTMKKGGILVTYCAQGQFRRDLRALGMDVQTVAGPPGKKEMTRAVRLNP